MEENRGTGRTTRLVQHYMNELFNNRGVVVKVKDHYDSASAHRYLTDRIIDRFDNEINMRGYLTLTRMSATSLKLT